MCPLLLVDGVIEKLQGQLEVIKLLDNRLHKLPLEIWSRQRTILVTSGAAWIAGLEGAGWAVGSVSSGLTACASGAGCTLPAGRQVILEGQLPNQRLMRLNCACAPVTANSPPESRNQKNRKNPVTPSRLLHSQL